MCDKTFANLPNENVPSSQIMFFLFAYIKKKVVTSEAGSDPAEYEEKNKRNPIP